MSTLPREPGVPPLTDDHPDTSFIARVANEFFVERLSALPAIESAQGVPEPGIPTAVAGIPLKSPDAQPDVPDGYAGSNFDHGLSRGYPLATASTHPPVHPVLERESDRSPITPSGAHDPRSGKSHPFGEPFFNGALYRVGEIPSTASVPGGEIVEPPRFYFLGEQEPADPWRPAERPNRAPASGLSVFDVDAIRRDFPALNQRVNGHQLIWLDNAATTQKPQSVIDATAHFYSRDNSNIHRAAHTLARRATELFETGREKVRQLLGAADAREIVFLRGTTEAVNLVAQSYGRKNIGQGDEIILTELEHHANIVPWQLLAEQVGAVIRVAPIDDNGEVLLDEFIKLLGSRTKFVSVAHVSNSLGTIVPVEQIVALSHARKVPVLIDGAQSAPHLPVNVRAIDADFYVFSGHKVFGPTGIGALYGKLNLLEEMPPYQGGGHMIRDVRFEKTTYQNAPVKFEAGTPDIAGVVGLSAAIDYLTNVGVPALAAYEHALLEYATQALARVPGLRPIGTAINKASVLSFVIPGIPNENIARHLDNQGIAVRAGHHCAMPAQRHFGLESTVRPSLAFYNTYEEVDRLVEVLHGLPRP